MRNGSVEESVSDVCIYVCVCVCGTGWAGVRSILTHLKVRVGAAEEGTTKCVMNLVSSGAPDGTISAGS